MSAHVPGRAPEPDWLPYRPSWSTADYHDQTFPADRFHESDAYVVPVIQRVPRMAPGASPDETIAQASEMMVVAEQHIEGDEIWVTIADETRRGVTITVESAWRLYANLGRLLHRDFTELTLPPALNRPHPPGGETP